MSRISSWATASPNSDTIAIQTVYRGMNSVWFRSRCKILNHDCFLIVSGSEKGWKTSYPPARNSRSSIYHIHFKIFLNFPLKLCKRYVKIPEAIYVWWQQILYNKPDLLWRIVEKYLVLKQLTNESNNQ
jgi:hypothetical protein